MDLGEQFKIIFTDSGEGIPSSVVKNIFNPFFTTKPVGQGTGLGLSISKALIESHCGQLVYKKDNVNTCFEIILPKKQKILQGEHQ